MVCELRRESTTRETQSMRFFLLLAATVVVTCLPRTVILAQDDAFSGIGRMPYVTEGESFAITAENPTGRLSL